MSWHLSSNACEGSVSPCTKKPGIFCLTFSYLACFSAKGNFLAPSAASPVTEDFSWDRTNVAASKWIRRRILCCPAVNPVPKMEVVKALNSSSVGALLGAPQANASSEKLAMFCARSKSFKFSVAVDSSLHLCLNAASESINVMAQETNICDDDPLELFACFVLKLSANGTSTFTCWNLK